MSDHGKPIDTLPTKNASELNLLDTLLGVSAGGEPAAFQTPLGELAESDDFLDALTDGLISRIIGQVQSNANGSYVRLPNGWQIAWGVTDSHAVSVAVGSLQRTNTESHGFPAPFLPGEVVVSASPEMTVGNPSGHYVAPSSAGTGFNFRIYAPASATARIAFIAIGRWK